MFCHNLKLKCQAPLSMGFLKQGYWIGLPFPNPEDLPDWIHGFNLPGIEPMSPVFPALASGFFFFFFNHWATWIALRGSLQSVRGKSGWIYAPAFPSLYGIIMRYVLHSFSESQWCWAPIAYRDSLLTNAILILFSLLCATSFLLHLGFSRFLLNKLPRLSLTICFWRRPN